VSKASTGKDELALPVLENMRRERGLQGRPALESVLHSMAAPGVQQIERLDAILETRGHLDSLGSFALLVPV
jgi:hypothetical protein